jgi:hypothetical protein
VQNSGNILAKRKIFSIKILKHLPDDFQFGQDLGLTFQRDLPIFGEHGFWAATIHHQF